jgi:diguanylate cyclase (GGDEF)-like protein
MISLRKASEAQLQDAFEATLQAYRAALRAIADAGARAFPLAGDQLRENLLALRQHLNPQSDSKVVTETGEHLETELGAWSDQASRFYQEKTNELKEILSIVAKATGEIAERDDHHAKHFAQLTERLREANRMTDLTAIRSALSKSVTDISEYATGMAKAGQDSLAQLRSQLSVYEQRLQEVERLASLDALTGIANRRKLETSIESRIHQKRAFCVIYLDLNGFKIINDTLGHLAGDELLKQFAGELKTAFRPNDVVGRWGGDEFLVIVDGDLREAQTFTAKIEKWVNGQYALTGAQKPKVQLSAAVGACAWNPGESATDLIRKADAAMYQHKAKHVLGR